MSKSGGARMSRQPGHFQVTEVLRQVIRCSTVKEPGYFEVRKSSSQVTGCTFFLKKEKVNDLFSRCRQNTGRFATPLIVSLSKQNK